MDYSGTQPASTTGPGPIVFELKKVELFNDYTVGILTQEAADSGVDNAAWSGIGTESIDGRTAFSGNQEVAIDPVDLGEALFLLPQTIVHGEGETATKVSVSVTYTMTFGDFTTQPRTVTVDLDKAMTAATEDTPAAAIPQWDPNKQYVYTIVLSYEGISFVVEVDEIVEYYYGMEGYDDYKVVL